MEGAELHLVDSMEEANALLSWLSERRPYLGLDTETSGLRPFAGDVLRLVQIGDARTGWAIPYENWRGLIIEVLDRIFRRVPTPVVLHNAKFDINFMERAGLPLPEVHLVHDTMIMDHLLDPDRAHGLKQVGERYWPGSAAGEFAMKNDFRRLKVDWATVPVDLLSYWSYSAWDPVLTSRIAEVHAPEVMGKFRRQYDLELAVQDVARRMERRGMLIDPDYTARLLLDWTNEMHGLEEELDVLGVGNPASARQVAQAMQLTEKWDPDDWTVTGVPKLDAKILKGIDSEISRRVLRHRRLQKWTSSYLESFLRERDDGDRLHATIRTLQARTGRMSVAEPPLHQLPRDKKVRGCFIRDEGYDLWMVDYDSMEARVFAAMSEDPGLIAATQAEVDIHTYSARLMYGDPTIQKSDTRRAKAKNGRYCRIYGGGAAKLADTIEGPLAEAQEFMENDDRAFPGIRRLMNEVSNTALARLATEGRAYVFSVGGRRLTAPGDKVYKLVNYRIQGGCADVFKEKLVELDAAGFEENMLLPVHDEQVFRFRRGDTEGPREAARIMEDRTTFSIPLTVELSGPYERWGDKYGDR